MANESMEWQVEVFFDGECPLCVREIRMLRWMDRRQRIRFTDISTDKFLPDRFDRSMQDFMDEIHGRLPDGQWLTGVEVFSSSLRCRRVGATCVVDEGTGDLSWA